MTRTLFTVVLILAVVLCPPSAHAQQDTKDAALREKAFKLLESTADQVSSLKSPQNRARLRANIADSLWDHDEKQARALFALVEEDIRAGVANRDLIDGKEHLTWKVFLKLRVDTVERIAKHDAEMALAFLKSTEPTSSTPLPGDVTESERGLQLRLATQMADSNLELAVKFARQSLDQGFSDQLLTLLRRVNKKDKEQALILYKEIVKKLRDVNPLRDWITRRFITNLVQGFKPSESSAFRELIGMLVERALAQGCGAESSEGQNSDLCNWVASIFPHLERIDPRAAQLKRWVNKDLIDASPEAVYEFVELTRDGTIDDLLAFASKNPGIAQEVYWHAIRKAMEASDLELARKLVTDHIPDPDRRRESFARIDSFQQANSLDDKKIAELQSRLNEIPKISDRVRVLLENAYARGSKNRDGVLKMLKQAFELTESMKPDKEQTDAQLKVAMLYCLEKDDRGLAIMESLLPKLNELVDAAVKLDGYETGYLSDSEWNMSANGSVGSLLTTLSQYAVYFAWCDFDRALDLTTQFERFEIRLMAQVKLAQGILAGPPKRVRANPYYVDLY